MKKVCIIGGGVSGLTVAKSLAGYCDVEILEKKSYIGGIAATKQVEGYAYHSVGGHCFNTKDDKVKSFVFEQLAKDSWNEIERDAKIKLFDQYISYPIEFALKEIYRFEPQIVLNILEELFSYNDSKKSDTLDIWFESHFGKTLAELYFLPYNKKIWMKNLDQISCEWVDGKLPIPSKSDILKSIFQNIDDGMVHAHFHYPKSNNQNTFLNALSTGLNYKLNMNVDTIAKHGEKWIINGTMAYDLVINTSPLDKLFKKISGVNDDILEMASRLRKNSLTTMLWEITDENFTWLYLPNPDVKFHRIINLGRFHKPKSLIAVTEAMGVHTYDEMVEEGRKFSFLKRPIDFHVAEYAYVVFDKDTKAIKKNLFNYLNEKGLYSVGRFGEWEYYNMDICIKSALDVSSKILKSMKVEI